MRLTMHLVRRRQSIRCSWHHSPSTQVRGGWQTSLAAQLLQSAGWLCYQMHVRLSLHGAKVARKLKGRRILPKGVSLYVGVLRWSLCGCCCLDQDLH